ncbi:MAG TPA: arylsulfotransferase family protein [Solirubrobacteraceae bacterium]
MPANPFGPSTQVTRRAALALTAALACAPAAAAQAAPLAISPAPGTPDASPKTQISILGVAPARIGSVSVTGATSGAHTGRLRPYSGGRGASFVPSTPLAAGEQVRVVVQVRGMATRRFSFGVAHLAPIPPVLNLPATQQGKLQHFVSEPALTPPQITVRRRPARMSGGIFLTPLPSPIVHPGSSTTITIKPVGPGGPMIVDTHGRLVWFKQLPTPDVAANLRPAHYHGRPVLTWWQGPVTFAAFGLGEGVIADTSYRRIATVKAGNGYAMDLHEFTLARDGDALFTVYSPVLVHLAGTPAGKLSPLLDAIVQAVDVRTGLVTWEWHALGHIPLSQSYATPANSASYDAYHINAIQPLPGGRVLISARDTSAIYDVDRASGRILWRLGGRASSFHLGTGARFWFQHHAQMLAGDRISVFDDEAGPPQKAPASRALLLRLDTRRRTAAVIRSYRRAGDTSAQSEGSVQELPGGNIFAGFGSTPFFSEFTSRGKLVFDASLPKDDGSYRVYHFPWSATPRTRPAVAATRSGADAVTVHASWNGATTVARWQVLAGADAASLAPVGAPAADSGFETQIAVSSTAPLVAARALSASGKVLATSPAVSVAAG